MGTSAFHKWPEHHDFNGARVLNLGCGFNRYRAKNVVNLDAFDVCRPDVVHDLNKTPLPFSDETFDFIIANHIMEHLPNWWACFNECARILKTGGRMQIWVPGGGSDSVRGFRDHVNEINHCSFFGVHGTYTNGSSNAWARAVTGCPANRLVQNQTFIVLRDEPWLRYMPASVKRWCASHLRNVVSEFGYEFQKITKEVYEKEQRKLDEYTRAGFPQPTRNLSVPV